MKYVDIHAHLESVRFEKDLDEVIERCRKNDLVVINSGTTPKNNRKTLQLSKQYSDVIKCGFGIYPVGNLSKNIDSELKWIEDNKDDCIYVGENGLDYNNAARKRNSEKQKEVFKKCLELAKKIGKPVVIHSRKAESDAIEILENEKMKKVVMHCFSGNKKLIQRCIENGWFFSVPAKITRLEHFKMLVEMTPMQQLLTETDSPLLSPVAGERNEPSNILITIKEIAKIKNLDEETVREKILENAKNIFELN